MGSKKKKAKAQAPAGEAFDLSDGHEDLHALTPEDDAETGVEFARVYDDADIPDTLPGGETLAAITPYSTKDLEWMRSNLRKLEHVIDVFDRVKSVNPKLEDIVAEIASAARGLAGEIAG